MHLKYL